MRKATILFLMAWLLWGEAGRRAAAAQVTAQVSVEGASGAAHASHEASVVLWLTPLGGEAPAGQASQQPRPRASLIQKNKTFNPHIVVVQVGSEVDFPNRDPFFHNVFSLFNGKRFDLGLYEAGSTRGVHFDRAGICYIFCNIHPQMSAVVVVVDTPYFAISDARGEVAIPQVPAGRYQTNFWEEHCVPQTLAGLSRQITVSDQGTALGSIHVQESNAPVAAHLNKYGKQYDPEVFATPLYTQP